MSPTEPLPSDPLEPPPSEVPVPDAALLTVTGLKRLGEHEVLKSSKHELSQ